MENEVLLFQISTYLHERDSGSTNRREAAVVVVGVQI